MSDLLSRPWLLASASVQLSQGLDRPTVEQFPRIVQLLEVLQTTPMLQIRISDKFHFVTAQVAEETLQTFLLRSGPVNRLVGGLLKIKEAVWRGTLEDGIPRMRLEILKMEFIEGEGCLPHGEPRNIYTSEGLMKALRSWLERSELTVEDLLMLRDTQMPSEAVLFEIPPEQEQILEKIGFWEVNHKPPTFQPVDYFKSMNAINKIVINYSSW